MRKLTLDVDLLAVESFEVSPFRRAGSGTVAGHEAVAEGGTDAAVVGPGTSQVYSQDCWTVQEECFITKDPRYYPCVCTYPVPDTRDAKYCAVEAYPGDAEAAAF